MAEGFYVDAQTRIERFVPDPAAPVHAAAWIAHDPARTDSIVELLMRMAVHAQHGHIEEGVRMLVDEGA